MNDSSEKAMEFNNEPRLNVDEQQDDKTCKVKSDIDDSDKVLKNHCCQNPNENNRPVWVT